MLKLSTEVLEEREGRAVRPKKEICRNCGETDIMKNGNGVRRCNNCKSFLCPRCYYIVEIKDNGEGGCLRCSAIIIKESLFL